MPFVKIDTAILRSTLWYEPTQLKLFLTALLLAEPREFAEPIPTLPVDSLEPTAFVVPPGWYGFVPSSGVGLVHQALLTADDGMLALKALGEPESSTRSQDFDGRRLVRIDGGFLILNYMKYRDRDYTSAERSARYRQRLKDRVTSRRRATPPHRDITQAEAEYIVRTFDHFWSIYPKRKAKQAAIKAWQKLPVDDALLETIYAAVKAQAQSESWRKDGGAYIPHAATWLNGRRWEDEAAPADPQKPRMGEEHPEGWRRTCCWCKAEFDPGRYADGSYLNIYSCPKCRQSGRSR